MNKKWFAKCAAVFAAVVLSVTVLASCSGGGKPVLIRIPEIGSPTMPEEKEMSDPKDKKTASSAKQESKEEPKESEGGSSNESGLKKEDDGTARYYVNGELQKDGVYGDETGGYYYADAEGVIDMNRCEAVSSGGSEWNVINGKAMKVSTDSDQTLNSALKVAAKCTDSSMTKEQKLRACFDYLKTNFLEGVRHDPPYTEMDWPVVYADDIFVYGKGDCFSYGAAFAYLAKAIGYDDVYACNTGGHGWAEVEGKFYDPEWDMHHNEYNHFGVAPGDECDVNYTGGIMDGVDWMRIKI